MSLDERFEAATKASRNLSNLSNENLLQMYAVFKQANKGDASGDRPSAFDFKGRAKFDAWANLKGTSQENAKQQYVDLIESLGK